MSTECDGCKAGAVTYQGQALNFVNDISTSYPVNEVGAIIVNPTWGGDSWYGGTISRVYVAELKVMKLDGKCKKVSEDTEPPREYCAQEYGCGYSVEIHLAATKGFGPGQVGISTDGGATVLMGTLDNAGQYVVSHNPIAAQCGETKFITYTLILPKISNHTDPDLMNQQYRGTVNFTFACGDC